MEYAIGTRGSSTVYPAEWHQLAEALKEYRESARLWGLRVIAVWNHSAAQFVSDALGLATPLVPTGSADAGRALIVRWLGSPEVTVEEKQAIARMWHVVDRAGASEAESSPSVPASVRMLLRGGR
jgi:hypothetical protein